MKLLTATTGSVLPAPHPLVGRRDKLTVVDDLAEDAARHVWQRNDNVRANICERRPA